MSVPKGYINCLLIAKFVNEFFEIVNKTIKEALYLPINWITPFDLYFFYSGKSH